MAARLLFPAMASGMDCEQTAVGSLPPPTNTQAKTIITDQAQGFLPKGAMTMQKTAVPEGVQMPFGGMWLLPLGCVPGVQELPIGACNMFVRFWHLPTGPIFCLIDILRIKYDRKQYWDNFVDQHIVFEDPCDVNDKKKPIRHGASVSMSYAGTNHKGHAMQIGQNCTNAKPVYEYFFNAFACLQIASTFVPALATNMASAYGNQNGLNGRAGAAAVMMQTADIAFNPLNTTANGYGGVAGVLPYPPVMQMQDNEALGVFLQQVSQNAYATALQAVQHSSAAQKEQMQEFILNTVRDINPAINDWSRSVYQKYYNAYQQHVKVTQVKALSMKKEIKSLTAKHDAMSRSINKMGTSTPAKQSGDEMKREILAEITKNNQETKAYVDHAVKDLKMWMQQNNANVYAYMDEQMIAMKEEVRATVARDLLLKPNRDEIRREISDLRREIEGINQMVNLASAANTPTKK